MITPELRFITMDAEVAPADTVAGPAVSDETIVVADGPLTEQQQLAWSAGDMVTLPVHDQTADRRPLSLSLALLLAGVCVGALIVGAYVLGRHHQAAVAPLVSAPPTVSASAAPLPVSPAPPNAPAAPPAVAAVPQTENPRYTGADARFLASIHADEIPYTSGDDDAIVSAHQICNWLADSQQTRHPRTMMSETENTQTALGWTFQQSQDFVTDAVKTYCPEQAR